MTSNLIPLMFFTQVALCDDKAHGRQIDGFMWSGCNDGLLTTTKKTWGAMQNTLEESS